MTVLQYGVESLDDIEVGEELVIVTGSWLGADYIFVFEGELLSMNEKELVMLCFNKTETELVEIKIQVNRIQEIQKRTYANRENNNG